MRSASLVCVTATAADRKTNRGKLGQVTHVLSYLRGVIRRRVVVSGDVQGVYFRDTCRRVATAQRVNGWVRNLPDGSVEAAFEGSPDAVAHVVEWAKHGPPRALVDAVDVYEEEVENLIGFEIRSRPWRA